jgi:flagellar hook assembly protein FlgD
LGHNKHELFSFLISHSDQVTVTIVDSNGATVATVAEDRPLRRYTQLRLAWDGRRGPHANGALAPSGEYRVRIALLEQHREIFSPKSFRLILHPKRNHSV